MARPPPGTQHLRCQYLYFCTSNTSKLSTWRAASEVSVFVLLSSRASKVSTWRVSNSSVQSECVMFSSASTVQCVQSQVSVLSSNAIKLSTFVLAMQVN
jgi:hypothetical protein